MNTDQVGDIKNMMILSGQKNKNKTARLGGVLFKCQH